MNLQTPMTPSYSMTELLLMVKEESQRQEIDQIKNAQDVFTLLHEYSDKQQEHFLLITLDGASKIIKKRVIFIGTLNQSLIHPREIFRPVIEDNSAGIIVVHNHPSGTLEPSRADIQVTTRLKEVGKLIGIELLDHIIISKQGYYSFSDDGLM